MRNVLVVAVLDSDRQETSKMLCQHGYTIYTAAHGGEALELIENHQFDCVLVDLFLSHVSGLEIICLVQKLKPRPRIIAMCPVWGMPETKYPWLDLAISVGADYALARPFNGDELLAALQGVASRTEPGPGRRRYAG